MKRQTEFTLKQLIQKVENGEYGICHSNVPGLLPLGVLLNEIGIILLETNDQLAEDLLVNILAEKDKHERFIACCFLLINVDKLSGKGKLFLKSFEELPENASFVQECRKKVESVQLD